MLKSCAYCGRIHDSRYECEAKKKAIQHPKDTQAYKIRSSSRWQKTRDYIRARDGGVCQLCLRNYEGTLRPYEYEGLSVHHIEKIEEQRDRAYDETNLITLCRTHHEMADDGRIDKGTLHTIAKENCEKYAAQ